MHLTNYRLNNVSEFFVVAFHMVDGDVQDMWDDCIYGSNDLYPSSDWSQKRCCYPYQLESINMVKQPCVKAFP